MAIQQTIVIYNGVTINHCHTRTFRQEPVFEQTNTDLLYYKFTVRVGGYVHANAGVGIGIDPLKGANAAAQHVSIRSLLMVPRGVFEMTMGADADGNNGEILLSAKPADTLTDGLSDVDLNNGPRGKVLDVTHVSGNEIFRVGGDPGPPGRHWLDRRQLERALDKLN